MMTHEELNIHIESGKTPEEIVDVKFCIAPYISSQIRYLSSSDVVRDNSIAKLEFQTAL